jgi:hypothetical protein
MADEVARMSIQPNSIFSSSRVSNSSFFRPADIEQHRTRVIDDLLTARNEFVFRHQARCSMRSA